jgi:transcriptional regulator with XRE-family HTH domain
VGGNGKSSQFEVAKSLGCSQSFLSKWIRGRANLRVETAEKWAIVLGTDPAAVIFSKVGDRPALLGLE